MTTTSDFSSEFITTDIAHRDCEACAGCADRARTMAKATGSVGATEESVIGPSYDQVQHHATVHRADRMHELHHAAQESRITANPPTATVANPTAESILDRTVVVNYLDASSAITDLHLAGSYLSDLIELLPQGDPRRMHIRNTIAACRSSYNALVPQVRG